MKWCTQIEVRDGEAVGIVDTSMVGDDHEFGLFEDGTRLRMLWCAAPRGADDGDATREWRSTRIRAWACSEHH